LGRPSNERRLNREPTQGLGYLRWGIRRTGTLTLLRPIVIEGVLAEVVTILLGGSILVLVGFIDDQFGLHGFLVDSNSGGTFANR